MACSSPLRLYPEDIKTGLVKNHSDLKLAAYSNSMYNDGYFTVPCRYCLNCRVDRQNELVDKCEYEYINYGCGAFVTLTYDEVHNFKNGFIDSHDGEFKYSINKKDGKDFLNRLNKVIHAENKRLKKLRVPNTLCRDDYKYVITHEYGDKFGRNHMHLLFFGLDFAYCERLFWKAWKNGDIEVGAIKNGGIEYAVKYISDQEYGDIKTFKYTYHHLTPPCSSHSLGLGSGLYLSQKNYIKKTGCYRWHNTDRPVPTYWKNKLKVINDLTDKSIQNKYKRKCNEIYNLYNHKITSYKDFKETNIQIARTRQANLIEKLHQQGKQVYQPEYLQKEKIDFIYNELQNRFAKNPMQLRLLKTDGTEYFKIGERLVKKLTIPDLIKLNTDVYKLSNQYGVKKACEMTGINPNECIFYWNKIKPDMVDVIPF